MQHGHVADGHVLADVEREALVCVEHRSVLDVGALPDGAQLVVTCTTLPDSLGLLHRATYEEPYREGWWMAFAGGGAAPAEFVVACTTLPESSGFKVWDYRRSSLQINSGEFMV